VGQGQEVENVIATGRDWQRASLFDVYLWLVAAAILAMVGTWRLESAEGIKLQRVKSGELSREAALREDSKVTQVLSPPALPAMGRDAVFGRHACVDYGTLGSQKRVAKAITVVTVRRAKALDFSGCNSRPGTGSLHPVEAIDAAAEATKLSKLSMYRREWLGPLPHLTANLPWAQAWVFSGEPDAGNLPVRFDEREQETGPSKTGLSWGESPVD